MAAQNVRYFKSTLQYSLSSRTLDCSSLALRPGHLTLDFKKNGATDEEKVAKYFNYKLLNRLFGDFRGSGCGSVQGGCEEGTPILLNDEVGVRACEAFV